MKTHVAIIYGGRSTEHAVSCRSAAFVLRHCPRDKYEVHAIAIDEDGLWWPQDTKKLLENIPVSLPILKSSSTPLTLRSGIDLFAGSIAWNCGVREIEAFKKSQLIVFPVLHGAFGEDGTLQGLLEFAQLPFVGPDTLGSAIGMDKVVSKRLVKEKGIAVVPWIDFRKNYWLENPQACLNACSKSLKYPLFVKPARLGSSVGVTKVKKPEDLSAAIDLAFQFDDKILVETGLNVREIECAVLGDYTPKVSIAGEVIPHREFYSYDAKYHDEKGASVEVPAKLSKSELEEVQRLTKEAFSALELYGLARIDWFLDKETGSFYFNEVNTIPGFTQISQYPMLWKASGVLPEDLIDTLLKTAIERYVLKEKLIRSHTASSQTSPK